MITFPCRCGFKFRLPDEMAGTVVQCPKCKVLADVPTPESLAQLAEDGTYRVEAPPKPAPDKFAELYRIFSSEKQDEFGRDIDLRGPVQPAGQADDALVPLGHDGTVDPRPFHRYDPETGERIRPLPIRDPIKTPPLPRQMLGQPILGYAAGDRANFVPGTLHFLKPLVDLFHPINLTVMFSLLVAHAVWVGIAYLIYPDFITSVLYLLLGSGVTGMVLTLPVLAMLALTILPHYANVIEETGPEECEELPVLLRHFSIADDLWRPFYRSLAALAYSYAPAVLAFWGAQYNPKCLQLILPLVAFGAAVFPAIFLTATTSGTADNLRPDRVLSVIWHIGLPYIPLAILSMGTTVVYLDGALPRSVELLLLAAFPNQFTTVPFPSRPVWIVELVVSIYLANYLCWMLGQCYRAHHGEFNWIYQRHIRAPRDTPPNYPAGPHPPNQPVRINPHSP